MKRIWKQRRNYPAERVSIPDRNDNLITFGERMTTASAKNN